MHVLLELWRRMKSLARLTGTNGGRWGLAYLHMKAGRLYASDGNMAAVFTVQGAGQIEGVITREALRDDQLAQDFFQAGGLAGIGGCKPLLSNPI